MFWNSGDKKKSPLPPADPIAERKKNSRAALDEINQRLGLLNEEERKEFEALRVKEAHASPVLERGILGNSVQRPIPLETKSTSNSQNNLEAGAKKKPITPLKRPI